MSKRRHSDDEGEDSPVSSEEEYMVEVITQARVSKHRKHEYLVKWAGYGSEDDSWEPYEHVKECTRLLEQFWEDVGVEKKLITEVGRVFRASKEWIAKERTYFRGVDLDEEGEEGKRSPGGIKKHTKTAKHRKAESDASSDEDIPLSQKKPRELSPKVSKPLIGSTQADINARDIEYVSSTQKKRQRINQADSQTEDDSLFGNVEGKPRPLSGGQGRPSSHRSEPKVKAISIPSTGLTGGISTKERLTKQMTDGGDQPPLPIPSRKFSKFSFKKKGVAVSDRQTNVATQKSPAERVPGETTNKTVTIYKPTSIIPEQSSTEVGTPWDSNSPQPVDDDTVINFLATIAPEVDVASQREEVVRSSKEAVFQTPDKNQNVSSWDWSGELFIGVGPNTLENLCDVNITNASIAPAQGLSFQLLDSRHSIQLKRHFKFSEFNRILPALGKPVQYARLKCRNPNDKLTFGYLTKYVRDNELIIRAPITSDVSDSEPFFEIIAELFIFAQNLDSLCSIFKINANFRQTNEDGLIVVLFPGIPPNESNLFVPRKSEIDNNIQELTTPAQEETLQDFKPRSSSIGYHLPRVELSVPGKILNLMANRIYSIWPGWQYDRLPLTRNARDSAALRQLLTEVGAKDAELGHSEQKAVFVHVTGLLTINKLRSVAHTRRDKPWVRFYSFGTHERVPKQIWGVREIFPLGGVVTFMPHALIEEPYGVRAICMKIKEHPRWMCYVRPSSLGYYIKTMSGDDDPLLAYDRDPEIFSNLLQLIDEGVLSVFNSPHYIDRMNGVIDEWFISQISQSSLQSQRELLRNCLDAYAFDYHDVPPAQIFRAMEDLVSKDLYSLQVQPGVIENYRRFIAIKSSRDQQISDSHNCIEWTNVLGFSFRDEYFSDGLGSTNDLDYISSIL